jgi:arylsulfatase A-like enzyme/Flp pilus assembly protein TadD
LRGAARLLCALLGLAALLACSRAETRAPAAAAPRGAPNVLLVTIDTLRADHVGAWGAADAQTPTLDRLAAEGVRFATVIAPTPLTLPSHASLLTGLHPPRHGVRHNGLFRLGADLPSLAQRFSDAGYSTGAVVGSIVLARGLGLERGFDAYDDETSARRASSTGYPERSAEAVTARALGWLAATPGPFFLWIHYYDPHAAYQPPARFAERFEGRPYAGEIAYVDEQLGRVLDFLREHGRFERTLVAVTSDHGESLGEHGERTHAYGLYDATLAVPLVLRGPGLPAARVVEGTVSLVSLAPTLLALAGLPPLEDIDGLDLAPLWRGEAAPGIAGRAYAETLATQLDQGWSPLHALRTDRHLYVRAPRPELYDVAQDPRQLRNLLDPPAPGAGEIQASLDREVETLLGAGGDLEVVALGAARRAQLEALGYALPDGPVPVTGADPKDGLRFVEPYLEARSRFFAGDLAGAEARATALLEHLPGSAKLHDLLARIYAATARPVLALEHAGQAVRLLPGSATLHASLGDCRLAVGDRAGAVAAWRSALELDPELAEAHAGAMWGAALGEHLDTALAHALRAVEIAPDDARLRLRIAETWDQLGAVERALAAYRDAAELDPALGVAHVGAAIQLVRLRRDDEVDAELLAAGAAAEDPAWRNRLGVAWAGRGERARAEAIFRDLVERYPDHPSARQNLDRVLADR